MPNRSRISPRCAGRSTVRTRCCNPISANWPLSPTWRNARRTTIAPRANSITASIATRRWTGGFFGPRAVIRRPRRAAPPPGAARPHRSRGAPSRGRPPTGRCGTARTGAPPGPRAPHPTPPPRVGVAPRLRAGRWCSPRGRSRPTTPRTRLGHQDRREQPERGWGGPAARPLGTEGKGRAGRARRGRPRGRRDSEISATGVVERGGTCGAARSCRFHQAFGATELRAAGAGVGGPVSRDGRSGFLVRIERRGSSRNAASRCGPPTSGTRARPRGPRERGARPPGAGRRRAPRLPVDRDAERLERPTRGVGAPRTSSHGAHDDAGQLVRATIARGNGRGRSRRRSRRDRAPGRTGRSHWRAPPRAARSRGRRPSAPHRPSACPADRPRR